MLNSKLSDAIEADEAMRVILDLRENASHPDNRRGWNAVVAMFHHHGQWLRKLEEQQAPAMTKPTPKTQQLLIDIECDNQSE